MMENVTRVLVLSHTRVLDAEHEKLKSVHSQFENVKLSDYEKLEPNNLYSLLFDSYGHPKTSAMKCTIPGPLELLGSSKVIVSE